MVIAWAPVGARGVIGCAPVTRRGVIGCALVLARGITMGWALVIARGITAAWAPVIARGSGASRVIPKLAGLDVELGAGASLGSSIFGKDSSFDIFRGIVGVSSS